MRPAMVLTACALYLFISLSARARASCSSRLISSTEANSGLPRSSASISSSTSRTVSTMPRYGRRCSRNAWTACSLAALEHGRMLFGRFEAVPGQVHRGERLVVERLERPRGRLRPIACGGDVSETFRRGQAEGDRQAHVRRRSLRDGGAVAEFHHGMHDGLRMHGHVDAARWHIEQSACFDDFKTFVHQRGRVDGHDRAPCSMWGGSRPVPA